MSHVWNAPADFAQEAADGFAAAHQGLVRRVPGGVARAGATPEGQVAVVIGGGSGHYPAFAGLVGRGLAHAAAMGDVFASPSTARVVSAARAVATPAGVLLSYGNYAGDALNFDQAQGELRAMGIPCETVRVTDDISSAPADEMHKRRGVAGDLAVFRAAAWAAEQGRPLADVAAFAARANARTRTLGVAFSGCTLPGASKELFSVPVGQIGIGMGIHGEPGIEMAPTPTAHDLGRLLVERVLAEVPEGVETVEGSRVAVILNGLGSTKGEELYVVYASVAAHLERAGLVIVEPEVGEFATSFDMAGMSLTLLWLDDELEEAWRSPAYTPAYRKGSVELALADEAGAAVESADLSDAVVPATEESQRVARLAADALRAIREMIDETVDELGRLDSIAGDGDHGIGMQRGSTAASAAADRAVAQQGGAATVLRHAGGAWADRAGGTSGALWGAMLAAVGTELGDAEQPDAAAVVRAVRAARAAVEARGGAAVGDKTMVDALVPFVDGLAARVEEGAGIREAWAAAAADSRAAADATADLSARLGRARSHGDRSIGTPDPGAISFALAMAAISDVLERASKEGSAE